MPSAGRGEIWRGCIESVPRTQWEAAECLPLTKLQRMQLVILPQAFRIATPPTVGFMVQIVKNSSLASVVGFVGLTSILYLYRAQNKTMLVQGSLSELRMNGQFALRETRRLKSYVALFLGLQTVSLGLFVALDLILFFLFFDLSIVGMYFVIAGWGHGDAARSAMKFFIVPTTRS